jgi:hypothetical protein
MARVHLAMPHQGEVKMAAMRAVLSVTSNPLGHEVIFSDWGGHFTDQARDEATQQILAHPFDYVLFMDSDNPPSQNPLALVELDLDIVGCPTPTLKHTTLREGYTGKSPFDWNVYTYMKKDGLYKARGGQGLEEVDAIGTGCTLIHRRVLEHSAMRDHPFARSIGKPGKIYSEDISFCHRARKAGFKIWAHFDYPCGHIKQVDLFSLWKFISEMQETIGEKNVED